MCSPLLMSTPWIARAGSSPRRAGEIEPDDTVSDPVASTEASPASEGAASDGASGRGAAAPPEPEQPAEVTTSTTSAATRRRRRQARTIVPKPGFMSAERIWDRPVGAGNSAVVVDLPRCGPMLIRRVPNLVPIVGITGSARCALRPVEGPRDHRVAPPTRCAAPPNRPTGAHRRRPELARSDRGRAAATEPSRVAGHPRHAVALAPAPHRRALDPTTATAGPTVDVSRDSPTRAAPRS